MFFPYGLDDVVPVMHQKDYSLPDRVLMLTIMEALMAGGRSVGRAGGRAVGRAVGR